MFVVKNPSEIESLYVWSLRLADTKYLALPLARHGRNILQKVGHETAKVEWMSPYGDVLTLEEVDFGVYELALNGELIGTRLRADDVAKLVSTIETSKPLIAWKRFKTLPTRDSLGIPIRIGFAFKAKTDKEITVVSVGRVQPTQLSDLEKFDWEFANKLEISNVGTIQTYTGLGTCPVLLDGDPSSVNELLTELRNNDFITYELRDIR